MEFAGLFGAIGTTAFFAFCVSPSGSTTVRRETIATPPISSG